MHTINLQQFEVQLSAADNAVDLERCCLPQLPQLEALRLHIRSEAHQVGLKSLTAMFHFPIAVLASTKHPQLEFALCLIRHTQHLKTRDSHYP